MVQHPSPCFVDHRATSGCVPHLADAAAGGTFTLQQNLRHWHPDLWPLQVQLQQQISAALAQHAGKNRGQRDWVTGMVWPVEGHVLKELLPGDSSHLQ